MTTATINLRVHSPIPGTYTVYGIGQRPVEGVAVHHYERIGVWRCESCRRNVGSTMPECHHIRAVKRHVESDRRDNGAGNGAE